MDQSIKDEFTESDRDQIRENIKAKSQVMLDYFAAAALIGYMTRTAISREVIGIEAEAAMAYEYARAMMKARSQRDSTGKVHHE